MADLALLLLTALWGTTFVVVKDALASASTSVFLVLRFSVAAVAIALVAAVRRERPDAGVLRDGARLGGAMAAGFLLQTMGLRWTTPARSAFLTGLSVLIVPFLARFAYRRKVPRAAWAGVAVAMVGLFALTRPFGHDVAREVRLGDLLTIGCAVAYAFQIIWTSEWSSRHRLTPLTLAQVGTALVVFMVLLPVGRFHYEPSASLWGSVLFTGLAMTAGAFFVMNWAQRHTTAVRAALIFALEPVAAALFSHWVGGEPLRRLDWLGGGLIVLGVIAGELGGVLGERRRQEAEQVIGVGPVR